MKILIIEDSRLLRTVMERLLSRAGHLVTGVADGEEGLRAGHAYAPDLILLDMMLPGLDGTCVLKALKASKLTAQIPVIVLTGLSQRNENTLKKAGAAAYVEKASLHLDDHPEALVQIVESIMSRSALIV